MRHKRLLSEGSIPSSSTQSLLGHVTPLGHLPGDLKIAPWTWPKSPKNWALGPALMLTVEAGRTRTWAHTGLIFPGEMRACADGLLPSLALTVQKPGAHQS